MPVSQQHRVLFLCSGNSARSILAESILNRLGQGRIVAHSAGSHPKGQVHNYALELLSQLAYPTHGLRSKSWNEFAIENAPCFDFVITVCDAAAAETCPVWLGHPMRANWGIPDPTATESSPLAMRAAFVDAYGRLYSRISVFVDLPLASLSSASLKSRLARIGEVDDWASSAASLNSLYEPQVRSRSLDH